MVASLLCGLSPSPDILISARFIQGAGAAMVAAMVLGIISPMFSQPRERTLAFSVFAVVTVAGSSLGLVLGGVVTQFLSWHWIFFINLPIGILAITFASRLIVKDPALGIRAGADFLGALLVVGAPTLVVYGVISAGRSSWSSVFTIAPLVGSVVFVGAFITVRNRAHIIHSCRSACYVTAI